MASSGSGEWAYGALAEGGLHEHGAKADRGRTLLGQRLGVVGRHMRVLNQKESIQG